MNSTFKIELFLSIIGYTLLILALSKISFSHDESDLSESFFSISHAPETKKFPVYVQNKRSRLSDQNRTYKSPFGYQIFENQSDILLSTNQNSPLATEIYEIHSAQYNAYSQKKENSDIGNSEIAGLYPMSSKSGKSGQIQNSDNAQSFSARLSASSTYNRPLFANTSNNDIVLIDPMTDPDDAERIPVGEGSWILVVMIFGYAFNLKRKLYKYQ